jgi:hypothetical protein
MGERKVERFWWGKLRERDHLEDKGLNGTIILKWMGHGMGKPEGK